MKLQGGLCKEGWLTVWDIAARPSVMSDTAETLLGSLGLDGGRSGTPSQDSATAPPSASCAYSQVPVGQELGELHLCLACWFPSLRNTGSGRGRGSSTEKSEEAFCYPGRRVALEYLFTV